MIRWTLNVVTLTTMIVMTNCYWFPKNEWDARSSPYLLNQDIQLPTTGKLRDENLKYPNCEVPDDIRKKLSFRIKQCNYRGYNYPDFLFKWTTAQGCYLFTPPSLFDKNEPKANMSKCMYNQNPNYLASCFYLPYLNETRCYPIDPRITQVVAEVERTMNSKQAVDKWIKCAESAAECCKNNMDDEVPKPNPTTCPPIWDGWSCWPEGRVGVNSTQVCSEFAYSIQGPKCNHFSQKMCYMDPNGNAVWVDKTDYSTCSVTPRLRERNLIHIILLSISAIFCTPAIIIMLAYKRLRTERLAMHRNLLIFIVLRNVLLIIIKAHVIRNELTVSEGDTIMDENGFWCRFLTTMEKFASSATFTCMLIDGILLHRRIAAVFKQPIKPIIIYTLAAAITILPLIGWIVLMCVLNDSNCWLVYMTSEIQWILDVPRICILFINTILFVDIIRVIITKLNRQDNTNQLSTAKATLFLMPLFGVQFLLTAWRPATDSCPWEQTYYIFTYVMESLQGILVAILYCYWNKEVHNLIRTTYQKTENIVSMHFTKAMPRRFTKSNLRRETCSTSVPNFNQNHQDDEIHDDDNNNIQPTPTLDISDQTYSPDLDQFHSEDDSEVPRDSSLNLGLENDGNKSEPFATIETNNQAFMYFETIKNNFNKNIAKS